MRQSRDSEQGVGKRLQMAFINLAEKQLTDAEKVTPILALTLALILALTLTLNTDPGPGPDPNPKH